MRKKMDILGIPIDDYSVRESMFLVEQYLHDDMMDLIETVTMPQLAQASEDQQLKEALSILDLMVIGDQEVLKAAGNTSSHRCREVQEKSFFRELMMRIIRNRKSVYLLGCKEQQQQEFAEFLGKYYQRLNICGNSLLAGELDDVDYVINEINSAAPDVVLSFLPSPVWEIFLLENRSKVNAKIWYGVGNDYLNQPNGFSHRWKKWFHVMVRAMASQKSRKRRSVL